MSDHKQDDQTFRIIVDDPLYDSLVEDLSMVGTIGPISGSEPYINFTPITNINTTGLNGSSGPIYTNGAAGNGGATGPAGTISLGPSSASGFGFVDPYAEVTSRIERLEAILAEEQEIRDNCPAVRNAYDEYRFLLVLAKKNKGDLL